MWCLSEVKPSLETGFLPLLSISSPLFALSATQLAQNITHRFQYPSPCPLRPVHRLEEHVLLRKRQRRRGTDGAQYPVRLDAIRFRVHLDDGQRVVELHVLLRDVSTPLDGDGTLFEVVTRNGTYLKHQHVEQEEEGTHQC